MNGSSEAFERDGYVIFRGVLDAALVAEAAAHVGWLTARRAAQAWEDSGHGLVAADPFWVRLASDERLLDVVETLIGPDIALFASHYRCTPPFDARNGGWRRDGLAWPLDPPRFVTFRVAIDARPRPDGSWRVLPGSHRLAEGGAAPPEPAVVESGPDPAAAVLKLELAPGDVAAYHPLLLHAAGANPTPRRRCDLNLRYTPTSARITSPAWPCALLLRGRPLAGGNPYRPRPRYLPGRHMPFRGCEDWV